MAVTIHLNGKSNSLVHKGSMGIAKSTIPDVCKTPTPGGPVPIPYPVIVSMSSDLKKGTKKIKVDGGKSAAIKGSEFSRCTGDEPGTIGGIKSSTNMKEATWILYSFDVKLEGKNACRLSDKMLMNHGNTACLGGVIQPPVFSKWDLDCVLKILCKQDRDIVQKAQKLNVKKVGPTIFDDPVFKDGKWTTEEFIAGGTAQGSNVNIDENLSCEAAAVTIYHEVWHTDQESGMSMVEAEYDAYYETEKWTIKRGLPGQGSGLRAKNTAGEVVASLQGAKDFVHKYYPVSPPSSVGAPPPPQIIGKTLDGKQVVLDDGSLRPVKDGDTFPADNPRNKPKEEQIPSKDFECP